MDIQVCYKQIYFAAVKATLLLLTKVYCTKNRGHLCITMNAISINSNKQSRQKLQL